MIEITVRMTIDIDGAQAEVNKTRQLVTSDEVAEYLADLLGPDILKHLVEQYEAMREITGA